MADAVEITGTVFKDGSATLMARVIGADAAAVLQADIDSISYTIYLLDQADPDTATPVDGHEDVACAVADTIHDTLQDDDRWTLDAIGYNFRHVLAVAAHAAFATAGRNYRIVFTLTPAAGEVVLVRFRVHCT